MTKNESSLDDVDTAQKKEQKKLFQKNLGVKQNFDAKKNFYITSWVIFFVSTGPAQGCGPAIFGPRGIFGKPASRPSCAEPFLTATKVLKFEDCVAEKNKKCRQEQQTATYLQNLFKSLRAKRVFFSPGG